ncbi:MAG: DUF6115 domain-containing protein [Lachnospira pectinoschiza]|uniref:DUF6115 domain-containing protein n=1 Tax=[Lactobacillus] rogosae TaxID=706562 RepID=UPI003A1FFACF
MGTVAIVLIVIGIICVIISIILGITDNKEQADTASYVSDYDSAKQVSQVSKAIDDIIEKKMQDIEEKTEASLDKISNTKILEMNEYADNVLKEINRNHNEVMFMYDMLNEKDKEIKTTVKSVNATNTQARGMGTVRERLIKLDETQKAPQRISVDEFPLDDKLDKNQKIMTLYNNGYNDIDIAKRLKLGVGEVRLVIKLYVNAAGE